MKIKCEWHGCDQTATFEMNPSMSIESKDGFTKNRNRPFLRKDADAVIIDIEYYRQHWSPKGYFCKDHHLCWAEKPPAVPGVR